MSCTSRRVNGTGMAPRQIHRCHISRSLQPAVSRNI